MTRTLFTIRFILSTVVLTMALPTGAFASNSLPAHFPECLSKDKREELPIMNEEVLDHLRSGVRSGPIRALVRGSYVKSYRDKTGHAHFSIDLDGDQKGDLEVIYQNAFGRLPTLKRGNVVVACGDYITDAQGSPDGGLIHWVHSNDGARDHGTCRHPDGYVAVNDVLYGITPENERQCRSDAARASRRW